MRKNSAQFRQQTQRLGHPQINRKRIAPCLTARAIQALTKCGVEQIRHQSKGERMPGFTRASRPDQDIRQCLSNTLQRLANEPTLASAGWSLDAGNQRCAGQCLMHGCDQFIAKRRTIGRAQDCQRAACGGKGNG